MRLMVMPVMGCLFETETAITARLRARLIQIDIDLGVAKWSRTTVTDGLAAMNETDRLVRDELHRAERVGLQLHHGLFEARARLTRWARPLVRRPCCRVVRSLGGDGGDWLGLCWHHRGIRGRRGKADESWTQTPCCCCCCYETTS